MNKSSLQGMEKVRNSRVCTDFGESNFRALVFETIIRAKTFTKKISNWIFFNAINPM